MTQGKEPRVKVRFIIDGEEVDETVTLKQPIKSVVHHVLAKTKHTGQPLDRWELKTAEGRPISMDLTFEAAGVKDGDSLYLYPKAGRGG